MSPASDIPRGARGGASYLSSTILSSAIPLLAVALAGVLSACVAPPLRRPPAQAPAKLIAPDLTGEVRTVRSVKSDTLIDLALVQGVGYIELLAANPGVDPWLPGEREIRLPTLRVLPDAPREGVVVNLAEQRLYVFRPSEPVQSFPVGIGREGMLTPLGKTKVVRKAKRPRWYPGPTARADDPTLGEFVPPGPDNPLGEYALYLGWPAYLIHGTNKPEGIGRRSSRGCLRMYPEDIEKLYAIVPNGTPVRVLDQPIKLGRAGAGALYLQAHPTLAQAQEIEENGAFRRPEVPDVRSMIAKWAGADAARIDWDKVQSALEERTGLPVEITQTVAAPPPPEPDPLRRLAALVSQWVTAVALP
jgi:L,D-transpeptidase ErfK/SrfK